MEQKDADELASLYLRARRHYFHWLDRDSISEADFSRDTSGERVWVAELDTMVVGFISAWESENYIHNLFVDVKFSRRGIGTALLNTCLDNIGRPARLKCVAENYPALDFYHFQGWQTIAEAMGSDGEYQLMQYTELASSLR